MRLQHRGHVHVQVSVHTTSNGARGIYALSRPSLPFTIGFGMAPPPSCGTVDRPVRAGRFAAQQRRHHHQGPGRRSHHRQADRQPPIEARPGLGKADRNFHQPSTGGWHPEQLYLYILRAESARFGRPAVIPSATSAVQNIAFGFADVSGMTWSTSQCSTTLPWSSKRKMSIPA